MIQIQIPVLISIALMVVRYAEGKALSRATFLLFVIRNLIPMLVRLQRFSVCTFHIVRLFITEIVAFIFSPTFDRFNGPNALVTGTRN